MVCSSEEGRKGTIIIIIIIIINLMVINKIIIGALCGCRRDRDKIKVTFRGLVITYSHFKDRSNVFYDCNFLARTLSCNDSPFCDRRQEQQELDRQELLWEIRWEQGRVYALVRQLV